MQLSRASTSSGTVTVAVTWLKAGVPVSNQNVVLTNVNTWSIAGASVAGGFDSIFLDPSGGANLTFGIDGIQFGGTCYGFSDVQPSDSFCNASEWLANRGVTLGCVAGQYCPTQNVTRAQMALFMQRLGDATATSTLTTTDGMSGNFNSPVILCETPIDAAPYPRSAVVVSTARLVSFSGTKSINARIHRSVDGGATWQSGGGFFMEASGTIGDTVSLSENGVIALAAGQAYQVAVSYTGGNANTVLVGCELVATVVPVRSGASAPFDPARSQQTPN